jgi:cytochrome c553
MRSVGARLAASLVIAAVLPFAPARADRAFGEYLASACVACHQASGAQVGAIPAITGWPEDQFVAVMNSYKAKDRDNQVMQTIAGGLKEDEIAALAAYFGSLKKAP